MPIRMHGFLLVSFTIRIVFGIAFEGEWELMAALYKLVEIDRLRPVQAHRSNAIAM